MCWRGEICKRCGRRNCVGFDIPDATWSAVVGERYNILCTTCFDELAQEAGVEYSFGEVWPVSWSDWTRFLLENSQPSEVQGFRSDTISEDLP